MTTSDSHWMGWKQSHVSNCIGYGRSRKQKQLELVLIFASRRFKSWIRNWLVYPRRYREVEVRRGDEAYGVNLHTKKESSSVLGGSSKKRRTIRIGNPIKRGEDNQLTKGSSTGDGNLTTEHRIDMEDLVEVEAEIATKESEQEKIRQLLYLK
ncbi:hypothetical protein Tco_0282517 [Tanacetum coccineum]